MISVALNLKDKKVLIVGGGKVALRKTKQMLKEDSLVTVLSPTILPEFSTLEVNCISQVYSANYLEGMFLVYAATNDADVNHQIMIDCKAKNILCGSAVKDEQASFFSMGQRELEDGLVAFSSHQKLPYTKPVLDELAEVIDAHHASIQLLSQLRPAVLRYAEGPSEYFELAFRMKTEFLQFIADSYEKGTGYIFVYHPSKYEEHFQMNLVPSLFVSIDELETLRKLLVFPVNYVVIPLVLNEGHIYHEIQRKIPGDWYLLSPLIKEEKDMSMLLSFFTGKERQLICMLHPRKSDDLKDKLNALLGQSGFACYFNEHLSLCKDTAYLVVMFLMSHGTHYHDCLQLISHYQKMGYDVENSGALIDHPEVVRYIENKALERK